MVRQIAPVFFTMDIPATLAYYTSKLGFACLGTWQDPPVYAIVARDQQVIHFRCAEPPTANPDKYADELLDAYLLVEDADALYAEYARPRRGIHSETWQHAMAQARVRGEGLRRPSAGFRCEPVISFQVFVILDLCATPPRNPSSSSLGAVLSLFLLLPHQPIMRINVRWANARLYQLQPRVQGAHGRCFGSGKSPSQGGCGLLD